MSSCELLLAPDESSSDTSGGPTHSTHCLSTGAARLDGLERGGGTQTARI